MATLHETTASTIAEVSDQQQVENLLQEYRFDCQYQLEDGTIQFYGYNGFRAYQEDEEGRREERAEEFLHRLTEFLEEELVIHGIGHEKCRFPLCAYKFRVTPEAVYYNDLNQSEDIIEVEEPDD